MSEKPSPSSFHFNWHNFFFPVVLRSDANNDGILLLKWLEDYDERMNEIHLLNECNSDLGQQLQFAMDKLSTDVLQRCFDFLEKSSKLGLFKTDKDAIRFMDAFYLDALVGTFIRYYDSFMTYFMKWEYDEDHSGPSVDKQQEPQKKPRKQRPNIPKEARDILSAWFQENVTNPYPKMQEKERLSMETGLSLKKIENWFINERSRKWHLYTRHLRKH